MTMNPKSHAWRLDDNWYKGSLHLHTTRSDGALELPQVAARYRDAGYDFIAVTDHWRLPQFNGNRKTLPVMVIDGIELDGFDNAGVYFHVLALGASLKLPNATRNFTKALQAA